MSFELRAYNAQYQLTELEEELVAYITENKATVSKTKIVALASEFFTVPNTITRFCRKLGYDGFTELKVELKQELSQEQDHASLRTIIMKNFDLIVPKREEKVVKLFAKHRDVNFYALEQTNLVAKIAAESFYALDDKFRLHEYESEVIARIMRSKNAVFFFISISGESEDVVELAELAKSRGHQVVSLTSLPENRLSQMSDLALHCYTVRKRINHYDVTDKTPLMIIMQSLYQAYLAHHEDGKQ